MNPTLVRNSDLTTATMREVVLDTTIADKDGYEHACTLCYQILEEDKLITDCTLILHYGFSNDTIESIRESVKIMISELENQVDYAGTILIQ